MPELANSTVITGLELMLVIFVVAVAVKRVRLPYTIALVLAGLGLGFLPTLEHVRLTPGLVLTVFLPVLLFEGAYNVPARRLARDLLPVALLAVPGVLLGAAVTGAILHYVLYLSWPVSLLFGALVAATDPIAVIAMFRDMGAPRRLSLIIEGESLFNDGTAITLFGIVLAGIASGDFSAGAGVLDFLKTVAGALAVGAAVGYTGSVLLRTVDDAQIQIMASVVVAYLAYLVADYLTFSGVIAVVLTGLFFGNYGSTSALSPRSVHALGSTWEFMGFVANSVIFLLIGIELHPAALASSWYYVAVAFFASFVGRAFVVYALTPWLRGEQRMPGRWRPVLLWGGLRGAVSLALALSLPLALPGGRPFPDRALIQIMAFGVVGTSLLLQGLTMGPLVRVLGLVGGKEGEHDLEAARARLLAEEAVILALAKEHERGLITDLEYERLYRSHQRQHERLARRLRQAEQRAGQETVSMGTPERMASAQRDALSAMYEQGDISQETLEELEDEVDERLRADREGNGD